MNVIYNQQGKIVVFQSFLLEIMHFEKVYEWTWNIASLNENFE